MHTALWAESTAAGARWACYDPCGCTGMLPDPASTELAAAGVPDGQVVHASTGPSWNALSSRPTRTGSAAVRSC